MVTCPVCGKENNDLAVTCFSCRSYLQAKVDALDLFATLWRLIESPGPAFRRIALASHKNYVTILGMMSGISIAFHLLWLFHASNGIPSLFTLLLAGILAGPPLGLILLMVLSAIAFLTGKRLGGTPSWRNTLSVFAYGSVPLILSLVFVFPIEVGIFGSTFFGTNPPPWLLKPGIYRVLIGINGAAIAWWLFLLTVGLSVINGFSQRRAASITALICLLISAGIFLA